MNRKTLLTLGLLAAFMLVACTPTVSAPAPATEGGAMDDHAAPTTDESVPMQADAPTAAPAATEAPAESQPAADEPVAMPTSRGSQLMATDPSTVNLTSGEPQLIEFFAFW